jgi:creatinine amidohydrolase
MHLSEATWTDVRDADPDLALLPVGSTEQHGPHAPLGTDALHAETVAEAGADATDRTVAVAPAISIGLSREHRQFPGTLWVSPDTFRAYVRETVESLAHHGIDRVVVVNGHGGNVDALNEVTAELSRDGVAYAVPFTWFEAVGDHASKMGHGGTLETALLRATNPDLVREDRLAEACEGASDRWGEWVSGVNLAHDPAEFTENGVVGDPSEGTASLGDELLELAATALATLLDAVAERDSSSPLRD